MMSRLPRQLKRACYARAIAVKFCVKPATLSTLAAATAALCRDGVARGRLARQLRPCD